MKKQSKLFHVIVITTLLFTQIIFSPSPVDAQQPSPTETSRNTHLVKGNPPVPDSAVIKPEREQSTDKMIPEASSIIPEQEAAKPVLDSDLVATSWGTIVSEGFEGSFPSGLWSVYDGDGVTNGEYYWDDDDYKPYTGGWSAWAANGGANGLDPAFYFYPNNANSWMEYGPFDLSNAIDAELLFRYWNRSEMDFDWFGWFVSRDGFNYYGTEVSGDSGGWQSMNFDLTNVPTLGNVTGDPSVWIAFTFFSDLSIVDDGPFVDEIVLQKNTILPPGAFNKSSPSNGATNQPISLTLSWGSSSDATSYEYCYDTTNDNACSSWTSNGTSTSKLLSSLSQSTTYYWHVRANNSVGTTYSNGLATAFWSFTTGVGPGNFNKSGPANGATNQPTSLTLQWGSSSGATSYEYCYSSAPGPCSAWRSAGSNTSVDLSGLAAGYTYYWQVRAVNAIAPTEANGGAWWSFTTQTTPACIWPAYTAPATPTFADVPMNVGHWSWVERLSNSGITAGCGNGNYCPLNDVVRAQMAIFLLRAKHCGSGYTPPAVGGSTGFNDVPLSATYAPWVKQLAAEGITAGCGGGNFCPLQAVNRAQMAIFLLRAKHGATYSPPGTGAITGFNDVPLSATYAPWVKQLAAEGITAGCGGGNFCPLQNVNRAQMATFLVRAFTLP